MTPKYCATCHKQVGSFDRCWNSKCEMFGRPQMFTYVGDGKAGRTITGMGSTAGKMVTVRLVPVSSPEGQERLWGKKK